MENNKNLNHLQTFEQFSYNDQYEEISEGKKAQNKLLNHGIDKGFDGDVEEAFKKVFDIEKEAEKFPKGSPQRNIRVAAKKLSEKEKRKLLEEFAERLNNGEKARNITLQADSKGKLYLRNKNDPDNLGFTDPSNYRSP